MASGVHWACARDLDILDLRSSGVSSQGPPRPCSPSTDCTALDTVRPFFAGFYGCGQSKNREINARNHKFTPRQRTNTRQSAAAHIEPNLQFKPSKIDDGAKIPTENPSTNYRIPMHFFPAVSQNQRRPFRRYKQSATAKVNCSTKLYRQAGTRRGVASEPLCVPPEKGAPRGVE